VNNPDPPASRATTKDPSPSSLAGVNLRDPLTDPGAGKHLINRATCGKCGQDLRLLRGFMGLTRNRCTANLVYGCIRCRHVMTYAEDMPPDLDSWLATMKMYDWIGKLNVLDAPETKR